MRRYVSRRESCFKIKEIPKPRYAQHSFLSYFGPASIVLLILFLWISTATAQTLSERALERYESLAVRSPKPGAAFDRVYQTYFDQGELDTLINKWKAAAQNPENT